QFMRVRKDLDGVNQSATNPTYNATFSGAFLGSPSLVSKFNPDDPATVTTGASATYGQGIAGQTGAAPVGGTIPITANNYLFGDFRKTGGGSGIRDFSDLD